jgi:hypothetical protein
MKIDFVLHWTKSPKSHVPLVLGPCLWLSTSLCLVCHADADADAGTANRTIQGSSFDMRPLAPWAGGTAGHGVTAGIEVIPRIAEL